MKKSFIIVIIAIMLLAIASCFLFPQTPSVKETEEFLSEFESDINGDTSNIDGENAQLAMAATSDFFGKGGTAENYLLPFQFLSKDRESKLLFDSLAYGTYVIDSTYDSTYGYWIYDWVLTDANNPANGYLYKWAFNDENNVKHDAELLFDSLSYYSGDPNENVPTKLYIALFIDNQRIVYINYTASYTTEQDSSGYDVYVPTNMSVIWGVDSEYEITISYNGHTVDDAIEGYDLIIDDAALKIEDFINEEWVEYTVTSTGEETVNLTIEYNTGWFFDIYTQTPETVYGPYAGNENYEYEKVPFTGELLKNGVHTADLAGTWWDPNNIFNNDYRSHMYVIFPSGDTTTIWIDQNPSLYQNTK